MACNALEGNPPARGAMFAASRASTKRPMSTNTPPQVSQDCGGAPGGCQDRLPQTAHWYSCCCCGPTIPRLMLAPALVSANIAADTQYRDGLPPVFDQGP